GTSFKHDDFHIREDRVWMPRSTVPTGFTLGRAERVGKHEASVIHYVAERSDGNSETAKSICTLWLDSTTALPLKRENRYTLDRGVSPCECKVIETFEYIK